MRIVGLAHGLFAIALASVAILSLSYGDFVPRGQPFPSWIAWRETWIYGSALLLLTTSVGLCFSRTALPSALTISAYQAIWALICALPILSAPLGVGAWYGFCEALAPLVGAWILYVMLRWQWQGAQMPTASARAVHMAQAVFGFDLCLLWLVPLRLRGLHRQHGADLATGSVGIRLPHGGRSRCRGDWHDGGDFPPPGGHPRSNHDEPVRPSGVGAELFCTASAGLGDPVPESMVGTRGEFAVGGRRVDGRGVLHGASASPASNSTR